MSRICIMVTGVGAIIGQGITKSLRMHDSEIRIVGIDLNPNGFRAADCDVFYAKPSNHLSTDDLVAFFRDVIERESVALVIPGIEPDVVFFDETKTRFSDSGAVIVLNRSEVIRISQDKWTTYTALRDNGLAAIPTRITGTWEQCAAELGVPMLMKPRDGSGGRGQVILESQSDFDYWIAKNPDSFMVQKIVGRDDAEYTVGVFGFGNGESGSPAIFKRTLGPVGCTWTAKTISHEPNIEQQIRELGATFRPLGPTNYQFRLDNDSVHLLEINPRFSSSTSLRAALGFNEAAMCIDFYLRKKLPTHYTLAPGQCTRLIEDRVELT